MASSLLSFPQQSAIAKKDHATAKKTLVQLKVRACGVERKERGCERARARQRPAPLRAGTPPLNLLPLPLRPVSSSLLQIKMTELPALPPLFQASPTAVQELTLARE